MPVALVKAYSEMLPRLSAEERLDRTVDGAMAAGTLKKGHATSVRQRLLKQAQGGVRKAPPVKLEQLSGMGIQVQFVE